MPTPPSRARAAATSASLYSPALLPLPVAESSADSAADPTDSAADSLDEDMCMGIVLIDCRVCSAACVHPTMHTKPYEMCVKKS